MLLTRNRRKMTRAHGVRPPAPPFPAGPEAIAGARIGRLADVSPAGEPLVRCDGLLETPTVARLAAPAPGPLESALGREVVLVFEAADPARPIVVGWIEAPVAAPARNLQVDGRRIRVEAAHELELRCGDASVTLTADGRVLIRGRGVLSHAKEQNRIRGGQVKIN